MSWLLLASHKLQWFGALFDQDFDVAIWRLTGKADSAGEYVLSLQTETDSRTTADGSTHPRSNVQLVLPTESCVLAIAPN